MKAKQAVHVKLDLVVPLSPRGHLALRVASLGRKVLGIGPPNTRLGKMPRPLTPAQPFEHGAPALKPVALGVAFSPRPLGAAWARPVCPPAHPPKLRVIDLSRIDLLVAAVVTSYSAGAWRNLSVSLIN